MESLLSTAFTNISSKTSPKISKGLRQIEGLLAQICLSTDANPDATFTRADSGKGLRPEEQQICTPLQALSCDPAFLEYFKLQERFEWNVVTKLVACLERLLGFQSSEVNDALLYSTVMLLHGALLLHPPSRGIFAGELYTNLLLDLLDASLPPAVQSSSLLVLMSVLLSGPQVIRAFEKAEGLLSVASLYKASSTPIEVKKHAADLISLYLLPEQSTRTQGEPAPVINIAASIEATQSPLVSPTTAKATVVKIRSASDNEATALQTRSVEDKKAAVAVCFDDIDELPAPFWGSE